MQIQLYMTIVKQANTRARVALEANNGAAIITMFVKNVKSFVNLRQPSSTVRQPPKTASQKEYKQTG